MLVFVLNQTQKANTGKIQTPVYENVREFGVLGFLLSAPLLKTVSPMQDAKQNPVFRGLRERFKMRTLLSYFRRVAF